jgi:3-hydroxyisobutyrate dehydrogenase-like beta-hydroxyacid dehydrogenase
VTGHLIPERVLSGRWPRRFSLALRDKDVRVALEVLADTGVGSEVYAAVKRALEAARVRLDPAADHVETIKVIEERAGVKGSLTGSATGL